MNLSILSDIYLSSKKPNCLSSSPNKLSQTRKKLLEVEDKSEVTKSMITTDDNNNNNNKKYAFEKQKFTLTVTLYI